MDNSKLNLLALLYNEKYLYLDLNHKKYNDVHINVIRYNYYLNRDYDVIVRVSSVENLHGNIRELMWEGPLNEWYIACSKAVFNATHITKLV